MNNSVACPGCGEGHPLTALLDGSHSCPALVSASFTEAGAEGQARVPDVAGELVGWRAWVVDRIGRAVRLHSVTAHTFWPANDWTHAECYGQRTCSKHPNTPTADRRVPGEGCTCGLYAARTLEHLRDLGYNDYAEDKRVIGQVGLAGKVIPGEQGFRAEKARILRLYVPFEARRVGQELSDTYRVPFSLLNVKSRRGVGNETFNAARDLARRRLQERGEE